MSRIIVKNLPKQLTSKKLQDLFSSKGTITDLQLKYNKDGVFRQFAFIGFKTDDEARAAKEYFDGTFITTSKIQVEMCSNLGDPNTPKPWKKFQLQDKSPEKVSRDDESSKKSKKKKEKKTETGSKTSKELLKDPKFQEFVEVQKDRKSKPLWGDTVSELPAADSEVLQKEDDDVESDTDRKDDCHSEEKSTDVKKMLKSKEKKIHDEYTVKLKHLPFMCKMKQIKKFFHPLKLLDVRIPSKSKGYYAFAKFKTEKEMKQALNKDKGFLEGNRIAVIKCERKEIEGVKNQLEKQVEEEPEKNEDLLAETGRIYVRNLCFSVTVSEIEELFSKYGPIAEVHLPIDFLTKTAQGFAFVLYVFAEHAIKAFAELDGTIFQGRLLHLIPAQPKKENVPDEDGMGFKQKKEAKMKALSGSSHNWNILFVGMNAVADVVAESLNIEKSKLLSGNTGGSVGVRMALAETRMVLDTREFLLAQGVQLDAFSQPAAERSKTVMVVKNLPAKTTRQELDTIFSKHGILVRVIVPPSGMVALVEFADPTEAKVAFKKLAYSQFHHLPLYLEWAPINAIQPGVPDDKPLEEEGKIEEKIEETKLANENEDDDEEPEPETTLFVKNINFDTTERDFKKHFEKCGPVHSANISTKKDLNSGKLLSMGFGFVQFKQKASAMKAIQNLSLTKLDGHALELKFSTRATVPTATTKRKRSDVKKQQTTKILVRNIPFGASEKEIKDLFMEFGLLKFVRLPKKMGLNEHRGFGFVEYCTKSDAKRAFETLCHSTHLLGRRLVLEWANPETDGVEELRKKTARDFLQSGPKKKVRKSKLIQDVALASSGLQLDD